VRDLLVPAAFGDAYAGFRRQSRKGLVVVAQTIESLAGEGIAAGIEQQQL